MELIQLQNQIRTLVELDETESPVVSCFYDREDSDASRILAEQVLAARKALDIAQRPAFQRAMERIQSVLPWDSTSRRARSRSSRDPGATRSFR